MKQSMTSIDPEPPEGSVVVDVDGQRWERVDGPYGEGANWLPLHEDGSYGEPESWTKVAGNYGPVRRQR